MPRRTVLKRNQPHIYSDDYQDESNSEVSLARIVVGNLETKSSRITAPVNIRGCHNQSRTKKLLQQGAEIDTYVDIRLCNDRIKKV